MITIYPSCSRSVFCIFLFFQASLCLYQFLDGKLQKVDNNGSIWLPGSGEAAVFSGPSLDASNALLMNFSTDCDTEFPSSSSTTFCCFVVWDTYVHSILVASSVHPSTCSTWDSASSTLSDRLCTASARLSSFLLTVCLSWIISYFRQSLHPLISFFSSLIVLMISPESMFVPGFLWLAAAPPRVFAWAVSPVMLAFEIELFFSCIFSFFLLFFFLVLSSLFKINMKFLSC